MFRAIRLGKAGLGVLALAVLAAGAMNAADQKSEGEKGKTRTFKSRVLNAPEMAGQSKSVVLDALRAYELDRKAGRIAKGDEEKALRDRLDRAFALNRSSEGLSEKRTTSGAVGLDLQGRYQYVILSRTDAAGNVVTECVSDAAGAEAFLSGHGASGAEKE